MPQLQYIKF
ncbi:hypothetical protein CP8484711_1796A, partial [Chlamydia psittaci 84-8471/1]